MSLTVFNAFACGMAFGAAIYNAADGKWKTTALMVFLVILNAVCVFI